MTDDSLANARPDELERLRAENAELRKRLELFRWTVPMRVWRSLTTYHPFLKTWFDQEGRSRI